MPSAATPACRWRTMRDVLAPLAVVQGNLDPLLLVAGGPALETRVHEIKRAMAGAAVHLQPRPRHRARDAARERGAAGGAGARAMRGAVIASESFSGHRQHGLRLRDWRLVGKDVLPHPPPRRAESAPSARRGEGLGVGGTHKGGACLFTLPRPQRPLTISNNCIALRATLPVKGEGDQRDWLTPATTAVAIGLGRYPVELGYGGGGEPPASA